MGNMLLYSTSRQKAICDRTIHSVNERYLKIKINSFYFCKMYTKEEASRIRQNFWTTFGQYISPIISSEGLRVNWINYKTGVKNVSFKMQADQKHASIFIEINHQDLGIQELFFEQFLELKTLLHSILQEEWEWSLHSTDEFGKTVSKIHKSIDKVNIFNQEEWPKIITFFKPRIIALDEFWADAKYSFDVLKG